MEEKLTTLWECERFRCLRQCNNVDVDSYIFSKIHIMSNASLDYLGEVLEKDGEITIDQALTIFESLKYRIKEIFHKDIFVELKILDERIQGKIIYKNENIIIFDFPFDKADQGPSEYIAREKAEKSKTVVVPNLEGISEAKNIENMLKELFEENEDE